MEEGAARRGGHPRLGPDGGGADLISAVPEDLLLQVLRRLGCARAAARTSLLSRHWRGLWRRLPDLTFRGIALGSLLPALCSLVRVPGAGVLLLDIELPPVRDDQHNQLAASVSSLLCAAAELSPMEFRFGVPPSPCAHLPCFLRATSIHLHGLDLLLAEPPSSLYMFPTLETLSLSSCRVDFNALVLQCPRLRVLRATRCLHGDEDITVRSASLQELFVESRDVWTGRIDFEVAALNRLVVSIFVGGDELSVSVLAPVVEKVSWKCIYRGHAVAGIGIWGLATHVYRFPHTELGLAQEIEKQLVLKDFSVLDLQFLTSGHAFGAFLLCLLRIKWIRTATKSIKISLQNMKEKDTCPTNCPCDEPRNWRSQAIFLSNLEEVNINGLRGEEHEVDILRLIFKSAPVLKRMTLRLFDEVTTSNDWCTQVHDIFKMNPSVECNLYPCYGPTLSGQSGAVA